MTVCAVASCSNDQRKTKGQGISYHIFPKDVELREEWSKRCSRKGKWNPVTSYICSKHFRQEDFETSHLKGILLGVPVKRRLKKNVIPSLFLPEGFILETIANEKNIEATNIKRECKKENVSDNASSTRESSVDYFELQKNYDNLLSQFQFLQNEHKAIKIKHKLCKQKFKSLENQLRYYKKKNRDKGIMEKKLQDTLKLVLTDNQLNLLLNKKKRVNWTADEMGIAFTLRYYSPKSYTFLKEKINYPLPALSSLRKWANTTI